MDEWLDNFARASFRRSGDTAHDLKTPLNVAVLNLELLRMRIAKLPEGAADEKIAGYTSAIETELRRLARIFDTFFLLSAPPKGEGPPVALAIAALAREAAEATGFEMSGNPSASVSGHESRMRQALKMFFEGATRVLQAEGRVAEALVEDDRFQLAVSGRPAGDDFELSKLFKFYYTDPSGNPDLALPAARLIVETYGGELNAMDERDKVILRLSFPLGDQ
jgi:nitrogen fixation/metabolism regulation signal transduction histidine kinase